MTLGDSSEDDSDLFRILISSDIHLGYAEKDAERGLDSFNSFDELLGIGVERGVDMVLLGGDLFHENKPSRQAEIRCVQILRNHVLGDRPIQMEYLSDPLVDYAHCNSKTVNYESSNLNIGLPVFSIHGNHDDPSGLGGHSCLDLIHETGFVNYFGKVTDLKHIKVRPILLRKGNVKIAIYGMSHVKDERLHRLFREEKVTFERPAEEAGSWFNILVLHQNRAKRGPTNYIPENFLPEFFHIVIWGHEHDCRIQPESSDQPFFISQPGSPVATSLCEGEALAKHVGVLNIRADNKFKMDVIPLRSVRPLIFKTISVTDMSKERVDLGDQDPKRLLQAIETELKYEVEEMISQADSMFTGHPNQGKKPLLRLRVEYTDEGQQLNPGRFGNMFLDRVANASEILLFKKRKLDVKRTLHDLDKDGFGDLGDGHEVTMEDIIDDYFQSQKDDSKKLSVLKVKEVGDAVKMYIDKDEKEALKYSIERTLEKHFETLMEREDGLEELEKMIVDNYDEDDDVVDTKAAKASSTTTRHDMSDSGDDLDIDEFQEVSSSKPAARGRGRGARGRGSRGGARGAAAAAASPAKRGRGARAASAASTQSTLAQSFARASSRNTSSASQSRSTATQRNKKQVFDSDSDD